MNTNQMMEVRLGNFGVLQIGHKTFMGSADAIMKIGNELREQKGLKPKKLDTYLRLNSTWEKIIKVYNEESKKSLGKSQKSFNDETSSANAETLFLIMKELWQLTQNFYILQLMIYQKMKQIE